MGLSPRETLSAGSLYAAEKSADRLLPHEPRVAPAVSLGQVEQRPLAAGARIDTDHVDLYPAAVPPRHLVAQALEVGGLRPGPASPASADDVESKDMHLQYVPLLRIQRDLHDIPRGQVAKGVPERFLKYLRTMSNEDGTGLELPPLVAINPMAKEHVTALLDALLALDADGIAARTVAEISTLMAVEAGDFKVTLIVVDDWMGWAQRAPGEFDVRFGGGPLERPPRWTRHLWLSAVLWGSEPATERTVREAMLTMAHRLAYQRRHGPALTLRDRLAQEGHVLAMAGCAGPVLGADDLDYTRDVLLPHLDAEDKRTAIECLFGDQAARALGFTPRGLSPWAGLALALHDALHDARGDLAQRPIGTA